MASCVASRSYVDVIDGFNNSQMLHIRVLQTIYRKLMGTSLDCARFGSHWQVIGFQGKISQFCIVFQRRSFQGADPATDLRGTGFLGLVHLIYLVMDEQRLRLALEIFQLSQDKVQVGNATTLDFLTNLFLHLRTFLSALCRST